MTTQINSIYIPHKSDIKVACIHSKYLNHVDKPLLCLYDIDISGTNYQCLCNIPGHWIT